jgi:diguanylate cyclase (GGDEF)-like protein
MIDRNFEVSDEPLWSTSAAIQTQILEDTVLDNSRSFLLSRIYASVNVFLLVFFGIYAATIGEIPLAKLLFSLAALIVAGFAAIWLFYWRVLAPHFTTATMALMCLCLFYTGGIQNTGPLYYFVFPTVALSLHGRLRGVVWVLGLLIATLLIWNGLFGFEPGKYQNIFVSRLVGISLLISLLACIPEYYRSKAERNLLLNWADLQYLNYSDPTTGLANRNLLGKILYMEHQRYMRYESNCCLMFLQFDPAQDLLRGKRAVIDNAQLHGWFGEFLRSNLRIPDIAGRWDNNSYLLILAEITPDGATRLAQRLLAGVRVQAAAIFGTSVRLTASIGFAALDRNPVPALLDRAADNLEAAQVAGGDCCVGA